MMNYWDILLFQICSLDDSSTVPRQKKLVAKYAGTQWLQNADFAAWAVATKSLLQRPGRERGRTSILRPCCIGMVWMRILFVFYPSASAAMDFAALVTCSSIIVTTKIK
jgi:hypothetical protein